MNPLVIHAGRARDEFEADLHARNTPCPLCASRLSPLFEIPLERPFVLRLQFRCSACERAISLDYLPGPDFRERSSLAPLELAASPAPSTLLSAALLEGVHRTAVSKLNQSLDEHPGSTEREVLSDRINHSGQALEALWELEKLPDAPADLGFPGHRALEARLMREFVAAGGRVPAAVRDRFSHPEARTALPFQSLSWVMTFFVDRASFEGAPLAGISEEYLAEFRFVVGKLLETITRHLMAAVDAAQSNPALRTPAPRPIVLYDALGLHRPLETALAQARSHTLRNLVAFEVATEALVYGYFDLLKTHHSWLAGAEDAAKESVPAWPLDFSVVRK